MRALPVLFLICSFSVSAQAMSVKNLSKKLNFTRGVYKPLKGSSKACVAGKFEIFNAEGDALHMSAAGSLFASNLQIKKTMSADEACKIEYVTRLIKKGFLNSETMECKGTKTFYRRLLRVKRSSANQMEYVVETQTSKNGKKSKVSCRLALVRKY